VAGIGTLVSLAALFSAAACCVLPLALAAIGIGAGGLAAVVPFHWPLTIGAALAVAAGWFLYVRKRRACAGDVSCSVVPPTKATFLMLCFATLFLGLSAIWPLVLEEPLMKLFEGA
jgi:mercuric ion transport protein